MDGWRATPRNNLLGAASDGLRSVRGALDVVPLPEVLGGGLGQLLIGKAPEEVNEWSYGNSPLRETPQGPRLLPQFRSDRGAGVVDTALLPVAETVGLAKLGNYGLRKMGEAVGRRLDTPAEAGRREFLQQSGALTGAAAAGAAVPPVVKGAAKLLDAPVEEGLRRGAVGAAARTVARATPAEFYAGVRALEDAFADKMVAIGNRYDGLVKNIPGEHWHPEKWTTQEKLSMRRAREQEKAQQAYEAGLRAHRGSPAYAEHRLPTNLELEKMLWDEMELSTSRSTAANGGFGSEISMPRYSEATKGVGQLSHKEILDLLRAGKSYTDPVTGAVASIGKSKTAHPEVIQWKPRRDGIETTLFPEFYFPSGHIEF